MALTLSGNPPPIPPVFDGPTRYFTAGVEIDIGRVQRHQVTLVGPAGTVFELPSFIDPERFGEETAPAIPGFRWVNARTEG